MIIGRFESYIVDSKNKNCFPVGKGWRYTLQGKSGYGASCDLAFKDWQNITAKKPSGGGLSPTSVKKAQPYIVPYKGKEPYVVPYKGPTKKEPYIVPYKGPKTVSNLQDKTNDITSSILPDAIEDKLPEGFPLWVIPVGLVGVLALILITKR